MQPPNSIEILTFLVAGRRYGLLSCDVIEVARAVAITPLQGAPAVVEGVINFRGQLVAVVDLRARFGLTARPVQASDHIILARAATRRIALRVDETLGFLVLSEQTLGTARQTWQSTPYAAGVVALPDGLLMLCDLAAFLSEAESLTLERELNDLRPRPAAS